MGVCVTVKCTAEVMQETGGTKAVTSKVLKMNVPMVPITVIQRLLVPTHTTPSHASATKASMEMAFNAERTKIQSPSESLTNQIYSGELVQVRATKPDTYAAISRVAIY